MSETVFYVGVDLLASDLKRDTLTRRKRRRRKSFITDEFNDMRRSRKTERQRDKKLKIKHHILQHVLLF